MNGSCHCGGISLTINEKPEYLFDCNCSLCGKLGVLWGYFDPARVTVSGKTTLYIRRDKQMPTAQIHFCGICGCVTHYTPTLSTPQNRMGLNMWAFPSELFIGIPLHFPDGKSWSGEGEFRMRQDSTVF